jgi:hypothetical protein
LSAAWLGNERNRNGRAVPDSDAMYQNLSDMLKETKETTRTVSRLRQMKGSLFRRMPRTGGASDVLEKPAWVKDLWLLTLTKLYMLLSSII